MEYLFALLKRIGADPSVTPLIFSGFIGVAATIAVLATILLIRSASDPARRRVAALVNTPETGMSSGLWQRWVQRIEKHSVLFVPRNQAEQSRIRTRLMHAGYRSPGAVQSFYALKSLLLVVLPMAVFAGTFLLPGLSTWHVTLAAAAAAAIGLIAPNVVLRRQVAARQRRFSDALPDALDLLVVCTEAGLGLKAAIQRVAEDLTVSHPEMASELAQVSVETRAGVERAEALHNLARRTGLEELRGLVALLNQTLRFGTSVADALRVYSEEFRDRRTQRAEELAAKIGTKMIFPLVFCLFPAFFLVTVGPVVIGVLNLFN